MKVAKLVLWSPVVRVIVEDTASDEEVANLARLCSSDASSSNRG